MKTQNLSLIVLLVLCSLFAHSQSNHQINFTDSVPSVDGVIETFWNEGEIQPLDSLLDGNPENAADLSAKFRTLWDEKNLYFLVEVTDESYINDSEGTKWKDDAIEIYLDINNDKEESYGDTDFQYTFRWNDETMGAIGASDNVQFVIVETDNGYVLECKIPWETVTQEEPTSGTLIGLDVHVHDDDDGGERDHKIAWYTNLDESYKNPSLFGTASLYRLFVEPNPMVSPQISVNRGFYNNPFDVTISSALYGAEIYYTLDGSDPRSSSSAQIRKSPTIVRIDPNSDLNRGKTPAVILRTASIRDDYDFSAVETRSYIFIDKLGLQMEHPGHDWPQGDYVYGAYNSSDGGPQEIDLTVDAEILEDERYANEMEEAMLQIPSFSIVTDNANLFDEEIGIYVNAWDNRGDEWERPASIELINPDGSKGFQEDAGLRIRGGWSRHGYFRKHGFRLFFKNEYGAGKLDFPLFGDEGVDEFDKFDLRCSQNYSWSKGTTEAPYCTFNRDVFSRDLQREMGNEYTRSRYYHLYLNGLYWGLYQTQERSESSFAASYFGGNSDDYDVIKHLGGDDGIEANDGTIDAWESVWDLCGDGFEDDKNYKLLQGLNNKGERDESLPILVDVDNLIDYMNVIFYTGNFDGPYSSFSNDANNFYAIYKRDGSEGFQFFAHDNEHTLLVDEMSPGHGVEEDRVSFGTERSMNVKDLMKFQPQWLHYKLTKNAEYRQRFADRAYEFYYNQGLLTPEKTAELFIKRTKEYDMALIAESAKWGDVDNENLNRTKDDDWTPMIERTLNEWFPVRSDIVIEQLRSSDLLPALDAPEFRVNNELVDETVLSMLQGNTIVIRNSNGEGLIKYTVDGSDPRLSGGAVSTTAVDGGFLATLSVIQNVVVKARIYSDGEWSALHTLKINVEKVNSKLLVSEIHYNPLNEGGLSGGEYEFLELFNNGDETINLAGAYFNGIDYTFYEGASLKAGNYLVLASSAYAFNNRYGFEPFGEYEGQLNNGGERISLFSIAGDTLVSVKYSDNSPWPVVADGIGFSIVSNTLNSNTDWSDGNNWSASFKVNGSPAMADEGVFDTKPILINEVLANSVYPLVDAIELYNPNNVSLNIGSWYLTDDKKDPKKWQIPAGVSIDANSYVVFYEGHYVGTKLDTTSNVNEFGSGFSLSSRGEDVAIFSANAQGNLTGYEHSFDFGDSDQDVSFGRYILSNGNDHFVAMSQQTFGEANGDPLVGPIVINQIMYHPLDNEFEYLELVNVTDSVVKLYNAESSIGWKLKGVDFDFPNNFQMDPNQKIYLVESTLSKLDFLFKYNMDTSTIVFNYDGKLQNNGEELTLYKAAPQYFENDTIKLPYIKVDRVKYNDNKEWPDADGNGSLLMKKDSYAYGNDPFNWLAVLPAVTINNYSIDTAIVGVPFAYHLSATGGSLPLSWAISNGSLPSGLSLNGIDGDISGIPESEGIFKFVALVSDASGSEAETEFEVVVKANTIPTAIADYDSTTMNINITVDVFQNDIDSDGDLNNCTLSISSEPVYGTAIVNSNKTITYLPQEGYVGDDEMIYQITDINGASTATLKIKVDRELIFDSFETRISQSSDDATQMRESGTMFLNDKRLEILYNFDRRNWQLLGLRFQDIPISKGTEISKAYIQFTTSSPFDFESNIYILAEDEANPSTYTNEKENISKRNYYYEHIAEWNPLSWDVENESGEAQQTSDLSGMVSYLVGKSDWTANNAMAFVMDIGDGGALRIAHAFDANPEFAPMLHIEYQTEEAEVLQPIANAGADLEAERYNVIELNGENSYSTDGRSLNFYWRIISKPEGSETLFENPYEMKPLFIADSFGDYEFELIVNNGHIESMADTIMVHVEDELPIANAGENQNRIVGSVIQLNGSASYDPDNGYLTYHWAFVDVPEGVNISFNDSTLLNPSFTAIVAGKYRIALVVSDGNNQSEVNYIDVEVSENQKPIANAGENTTVYTGAKVILDGSNSYDPEEYGLSYNWQIISTPKGSTAQLFDTTKVNPYFFADVEGEYRIELVVSDGNSESNAVQVLVSVEPNSQPVANAGSDKNQEDVETITLDGSASFDPDGTALSFIWTFVTKPAGSTVSLINANTENPSFEPDVKGLYTIRLMVSDGVSTSVDDVQIFVSSILSVLTIDYQQEIIVYPNPFNGILNLKMDENKFKGLSADLISVNGQLLKHIQLTEEGQCQFELNYADVVNRNGVYILKINAEGRKPKVFTLMYNLN